jgi:hypothetical protein
MMRDVADLAGVSIAIMSHVVERDSIGWVCTPQVVERHHLWGEILRMITAAPCR